jgi:hypothetical protein
MQSAGERPLVNSGAERAIQAYNDLPERER